MIRGWDEVELFLHPKQLSPGINSRDGLLATEPVDQKEELPSLSPHANSPMPHAPDMAHSASMRSEIGVGDFKSLRQTSHLILAIHGIGQQLGARTDAVNFVNGLPSLYDVLY